MCGGGGLASGRMEMEGGRLGGMLSSGRKDGGEVGGRASFRKDGRGAVGEYACLGKDGGTFHLHDATRLPK